ncbi:MAG TPA: hypothetical protein VIH99_04110, partial [Bdellovibrionota bacterium]
GFLGGEPKESLLHCGGTYYRAHDNPTDIGRPFYQPEPSQQPVNGGWLTWTSKIDADKVQAWAKEAGCQ